MVEIAGNGGIDQAALTQFERNFMTLAQQKQSKLEASGVVRYLPTDGKYNTLPRIGKLELVEVNGRNPLKQYTDYSVDNRMLRKRRFTTSVLLDNKNDVNELIADPTSYIMEALIAAKNRSIDRVITSSAIGPVLVGSPNGPQEYLSAEDDGVATVDATSGVNYGTYTAVTEMFINKEIPMDMIERVKLLITGKENTALMNEDKFINNRYISARPVEKGVVNDTYETGIADVNNIIGSYSQKSKNIMTKARADLLGGLAKAGASTMAGNRSSGGLFSALSGISEDSGGWGSGSINGIYQGGTRSGDLPQVLCLKLPKLQESAKYLMPLNLSAILFVEMREIMLKTSETLCWIMFGQEQYHLLSMI